MTWWRDGAVITKTRSETPTERGRQEAVLVVQDLRFRSMSSDQSIQGHLQAQRAMSSEKGRSIREGASELLSLFFPRGGSSVEPVEH